MSDTTRLNYARDRLLEALADSVRTILVDPSPAGKWAKARELEAHTELFMARLDEEYPE
jgi:hypothetical protein